MARKVSFEGPPQRWFKVQPLDEEGNLVGPSPVIVMSIQDAARISVDLTDQGFSRVLVTEVLIYVVADGGGASAAVTADN